MVLDESEEIYKVLAKQIGVLGSWPADRPMYGGGTLKSA